MKTKKIDASLLVIGLGGSGFDAVMRVKKDFSDCFEPAVYQDGSQSRCAPRTEFCVIHNNSSVMREKIYGLKLEEDEFVNIFQFPYKSKEAIGRKEYVREWFDSDSVETPCFYDWHDEWVASCCWNRQSARLLLFDKFQQVFMRLIGKLQVLRNAKSSETVQVKLISSLSGSIGSGILLDTAYILRHAAKVLGCPIHVEAFLIMPDVTIAHAACGDPVRTKLFSANAYAALKEVDYWMNAEENGLSMKQQYDSDTVIEWEGAPFDDVYLLCSQNEMGQSVSDPYSYSMNLISEYVVRSLDSGSKAGQSSTGGANPKGIGFALQSLRDDQKALSGMMDHPYPVAYRYHSLGAFSDAGEDRLMELKQWTMIYQEVVSRMDEHPALMNGNAPVDFCSAILGMDEAKPTAAGAIRQNYNSRHPYPGNHTVAEQTDEVYSRRALKNCDPNCAPHGDLYVRFNRQIGHALGDEQEMLKKEVWALFENQARKIGEDPERGPEYLYSLLTRGENSLMTQLNAYIDKIEGKRRAACCSKEDHLRRAEAAFRAFQSCTISDVIRGAFRGRLCVEKEHYDNYIMQCDSLYAACRAAAYYEALLEALRYLKRQLLGCADVLGDLVAAIREQKEGYESELQTARVSAALFNVNKMNERLTEIFARRKCRDAFVQQMYRNVTNISMRFRTESIPADELSEYLDEAIDDLRRNEFIEVDSMTISQKIQTYENAVSDEDIRSYVKTRLCSALQNGARVMYSVTADLNGLPANFAVETVVITAPDDPIILAGISEYCQMMNLRAVVKKSDRMDRISWVCDKGGMPLYIYRALPQLRDYYYSVCCMHKGYHLYMNCDPAEVKDPMKKHWKNLPDPFIIRYREEKGEEAEILKAAEAAGVLEVSFCFCKDGSTRPGVNIREHLLAPPEGAAVSYMNLHSAMGELPINKEQIDALKPVPANMSKTEEMRRTLEAYASYLNGILDNRECREVKIEHLSDKARAWGDVLEVSRKMILLNTQMSADEEKTVREAWEQAYGRAIREALSRRPELLKRLELHTECVKILKERIGETEELIGYADRYIQPIGGGECDIMPEEHCKEFARMLMYGLLQWYPSKIIGQLPKGSEQTVYSQGEECECLAGWLEDFDQFPLLIQAAAMYAYERRKSEYWQLLNKERVDIDRRIYARHTSAEEIEKILERSEALNRDLKVIKKRLISKYADGALTQAGYRFCMDVLRRMLEEVDAFIDTWEDT